VPEIVSDTIAQIDRLGKSLQFLSHVDDPLIKLVFSPGTNRTIIELGALKGRLESVQSMRTPSNSAAVEAPPEVPKAVATVEKRVDSAAKK
jgi:hypothetical protein